MGSFNISGCVSQLPIVRGDNVIALLSIKKEYTELGKFDGQDEIEVLCLPFFGVYDDYGILQDIRKDIITSYIEDVFGDDIYKIVKTINSLSNRNILLLSGDIVKKVRKMFGLHTYTDEYIQKNICINYEHLDFYTELISKYKLIDGFELPHSVHRNIFISEYLLKYMWGFNKCDDNVYSILDCENKLLFKDYGYYIIDKTDKILNKNTLYRYDDITQMWNKFNKDYKLKYDYVDYIKSLHSAITNLNQIITVEYEETSEFLNTYYSTDYLEMLNNKHMISSESLESTFTSYFITHGVVQGMSRLVLNTDELIERIVDFDVFNRVMTHANLFYSCSNYVNSYVNFKLVNSVEKIKTNIIKKQKQNYE